MNDERAGLPQLDTSFRVHRSAFIIPNLVGADGIEPPTFAL
jgi:hypothetical protein